MNQFGLIANRFPIRKSLNIIQFSKINMVNFLFQCLTVAITEQASNNSGNYKRIESICFQAKKN